MRQEFDVIRDSQAWMRRLIDHAPVTIATIDRHGTILSINRTLTGQSPQNVLGHSCLEYLPEPAQEKLRHALIAAFDDGKYAQFEFVWPHGQWWEARFAPILDDGEAEVGVVVMNDITARKRAEERARRRLAELAHVHRVNTMGTMVSELAHEINQPLYAIANFAEASLLAMREGNFDRGDEILTWLERIVEQANRAGTIVRRLGRLVRTEPSERAKVDLNRLIAEVIELTRPRLRRDEVEITFRPAARLPRVLVDPVQIEQVVVNLIQNAVEAITTTGAKRRCVLVETLREGKAAVQVVIADTAASVLPDDVEVMFEPFFTTKSEGMGMGLAICRSIVEDHGGQITAMRNAEEGATFMFRLPLSPPESKHA